MKFTASLYENILFTRKKQNMDWSKWMMMKKGMMDMQGESYIWLPAIGTWGVSHLRF